MNKSCESHFDDDTVMGLMHFTELIQELSNSYNIPGISKTKTIFRWLGAVGGIITGRASNFQ